MWQYCSEIGGKTAIYMWQQYDTASCIRGVTSVVCLARCQGFYCLRKLPMLYTKAIKKRYQIMKMVICTKGFGELTCVIFFSFSLISIKRCCWLFALVVTLAMPATQGNTSCLENIVIFREGKQTETEFSNRVMPSSI